MRAALPRVHADVSPESSPNLADAKARPWLKTRQPRACVYAGSLETYAPVFASIDDAQPVAHLAGAFAVEVDELTPGTSDGGRTRIDLSWPVRATWWLDASAKPLELARRVDIVPGHVWLEPGSPVTVTRRAGTRVTVVRDLTERGRRKVEPQSFQATLNCSELRLASYAKALWAHEGERMLLPTEGARLFDAPGGKPVARVEGGTFFPVFLRARRAGFARVVGNNGFVFDGWVESKDVTGKAQAMLASAPPTLYSHVIDAQLPLRAEPRTSSPIVATLVPGALVTLHGHTSTFTELAVVGLGEVGRAHRFFVDTAEFNRAATAAALGPR